MDSTQKYKKALLDAFIRMALEQNAVLGHQGHGLNLWPIPSFEELLADCPGRKYCRGGEKRL